MITISSNEKITPYDAWCIYTAISLHFKEDSEYDAIKYNFKGPRCSQSKFDSSRTKFLFEKFASKYSTKNEFICFCIANEVAGLKWINEYTEKTYQAWIAKLQRLDYTFKEDINTLEEESNIDSLSFNECIIPADHQGMPLIYKLYKTEKITIETITILENLVQYIRDVKSKISDPMGVNEKISHMISKYAPFLISKMNPSKYSDIITSSFTF